MSSLLLIGMIFLIMVEHMAFDINRIAKDLIKKLLVPDPKKRLNADEILSHPWIVGDVTPRKKLPQVTEKIKEFNAKRRFKVIPI
jgi:Protein kinase domain.